MIAQATAVTTIVPSRLTKKYSVQNGKLQKSSGGVLVEGNAIVYEFDGLKVFIDPKSFRLLDGTVLGYDTSLISRGFLFENPHAKTTCGCGISFSVEDTHFASPDGLAQEDHQ